ncbi:peptide transporter [candidate division LCP-89 bacterium B3_LCP]|uniref:Peptide transporter n=1 Tax=candidate division LCP-89 bacterium B3_LCP TaxID=2012998 RepID=A0A532UYD4_UNCL8|nr:MAG: peptide transporter [candidate division LCP-89 bacterium B3_LCP]
MSDKPLPQTPEEIEKEWFLNVYTGRGDSMVQLTWRAIVMGWFLGGFMSLSNLYIGLKTGWGLGVAITSCILSFTIWKSLRKLFPRLLKTDFTILENNAMQSTASAAGYSTGGTLVSAISAYLLVNGVHIPYGLLTAWIFFLAILGVSLAIPMKRQMINVEQLKFPSGIAAAETLKSLHGMADVSSEHAEVTSADAAKDSARALFAAGSLGAVIAILRDALEWIPAQLYIFGSRLGQYTIAFDNSVLLVAAGAIMGFRVAWSIMLGAVLCWGVFTPWMHSLGIIEELTYKSMVSWTLWGGAACMVTSGLLSFGLQWRTALRAFSGISAIFSKREKVRDPIQEKMDAIEVPGSWFMIGMTVGGIGVVYIINAYFGVAVWMAVLAIIMSFFLALVACRATGETDTTPIGAMGKITQLFYGAIAPRQMNVNLMTACVTAGVADSASDLLIDLKSGYRLGANPRLQFLAQFMGIFAGTAVIVPAFYLIVPNVDVLGSDKFPAPAAQVWASVAKLLSNGFTSLHVSARWALVIGGVIGIIIPLLEKAFPNKRKYIPSAMGLGLSWTFHFWYALSMFLGGLIALILEKKKPAIAEKYTIASASGIIAGESLMGVFITLLFAMGWLGG